MDAVLAGAAYFVFVFFKAFQQRNVAFLHYRWIVPTSFAMATTEIFVISVVAIRAVAAESVWELTPLCAAIAIGGGTGAICSMWLHHRYLGRRDR